MIAHVASLHFSTVTAARELYGGYYEIAAVAKGATDPSILEITDKVQHWEGPYQLGSGGKRARMRSLIFGEDIARDIVAQWTQNGLGMSPDCHPAIWVVRETMPEIGENGIPLRDEATERVKMRVATDEEKAVMWVEDKAQNVAAGRNYADWLFLDADATYKRDPRLVQFIPKQARDAARFFGLDATWTKTAAELPKQVVCQYCKKMVDETAIKCSHCSEVINYARYAEEEWKKQQALKARGVDVERRPVRA